MTDLSTQLRGYFDEIDPPLEVADLITEQPPLIRPDRRPVTPPRRRPRWVFAVAAGVLVLLAVGGTWWLFPSDDVPLDAVASLKQLGVDDIPAFRATVEHSIVLEGGNGAVYLASYGGPGGGMRWETLQQRVFDPRTGELSDGPLLGYVLSVWDGGTSAGYVVREDRDFFERIDFDSRAEALSAGVGLGDLTWQTGAWEARCTGGDADPLRGDHTVLGTAEILGRSVTRIECRSLREMWTLWVDPETGLMLRIEGRADVAFDSTEGRFEVTALDVDPDFQPGLFDVAPPPGAVDVADIEQADVEGSGPTSIIEDSVVGTQPFYLRARYVEQSATRTLDVWWQSKDRWRVEILDGPSAGSYAVAGEPGIGGYYYAATDTWGEDPFAATWELDGWEGFAAPIVDITPGGGFAPRFFTGAAVIATVDLADVGCAHLGAGTLLGRSVEQWSCIDGELSIHPDTGLVLSWAYEASVSEEGAASAFLATYEVLALDPDPVLDPSLFVFEPRGTNETPSQAQTLVGQTAPEMTGELLRGGSFDLADHRGARVVLLFWASYCRPCVEDLGDFAAVAEARGDLTFVTVLVQDDPAVAADVVAAAGYTLPVAVVPNTDAFWQYTWPIEGIPATVFVEGDGTIVEVHLGLLGSEGFRDTLDRLGW